MKSPYAELKRSTNILHNISNEDLKKFIALGKINQGMVVLDAMSGRSEIGLELSTVSNNIYIYIYIR